MEWTDGIQNCFIYIELLHICFIPFGYILFCSVVDIFYHILCQVVAFCRVCGANFLAWV